VTVAVMMKAVYLQQMLEVTHVAEMLKANSMISTLNGKRKICKEQALNQW